MTTLKVPLFAQSHASFPSVSALWGYDVSPVLSLGSWCVILLILLPVSGARRQDRLPRGRRRGFSCSWAACYSLLEVNRAAFLKFHLPCRPDGVTSSPREGNGSKAHVHFFWLCFLVCGLAKETEPEDRLKMVIFIQCVPAPDVSSATSSIT